MSLVYGIIEIVGEGQGNLEGGAQPFLRFDRNRSPRDLTTEPLDRGEAQAASLVQGLSGEKGLENMGQNILADSRGPYRSRSS